MNLSAATPVRLLFAAVFVALLVVFGIYEIQAYVGATTRAAATVMPSAVAVQPTTTATATDTPTLIPATDMPTLVPATATNEPGATPPTATRTPLPSLTPSRTLTPSPSPTSAPQIAPVLPTFILSDTHVATATPPTAVPTAVPTFEMPPGTTNVLLLGSDAPATGPPRSDTMIVVSINRERQTAAMLSLPRDLYVYIPGFTMSRLNNASSANGALRLKETILYNFGVPIHYYALVDFAGFQQVVDTLGGVEVAVSCRLRDWRLISPDMDPQVEENWRQYTLEPAIYQMDGDLALWYARSRLSSSDFDRGRRQQQLLRAIFNQALDVNILPQIPSLFNAYRDTVETDMDIGRLLQLATIANGVRNNGIQHLYLAGKTQPWIVPDTGAQVQLPIWEGPGMMQETFRRLFLPPALNRASRPPIFVEVVNASGHDDYGRLASENLAWYGFAPIIGDATGVETDTTIVTYNGDNAKGSFDWLISWIMGVYRSQIRLESVPTAAYNYQVTLGADYNPCVNPLFAPQPDLP